MPAGRAVLPALTDADVAAMRSQLERGRTPRVRLLAGGTGTVVSVGDPRADGPEYIRVKLTLNGTRDTLPFAPEDLVAVAAGAKAPWGGHSEAGYGGASGGRNASFNPVLFSTGRAIRGCSPPPPSAEAAAAPGAERGDHLAYRWGGVAGRRHPGRCEHH